MATIPKPKKKKPSRKPRKLRTHLPALSVDRLKLTIQQIDALTIPSAAKGQLKAMLTAAANPDSERVDVIIKALAAHEQANIADTTAALNGVFGRLARRGGAGLMAIDENLWTRLVEDAGKGDE